MQDLDYFKKLAFDISESIIAWRRELHKIPEPGIHTPETQAFICAELDKMGIPYKKDIGGNGCTGVVAIIEGKGTKSKKVFAIRADCDGLPIKEETGLPFASTNNNMHACGHDAHTAIALGTAKILSENADKLEGCVKLIFQPGEEGNEIMPGGAKRMLDHGALMAPRPDVITGLHVGMVAPGTKPGTFNYRKTALMASMDKFTIKVCGIGSHGAYPHKSVDPIAISAQIISAVQTIVSREFSAFTPIVISFGSIHAGTAFNIIPAECTLTGTVRALKSEVRETLARRIEEIAKAVAGGMRGSIEFDFTWEGSPPLVNNPEVTEEFRKVAEQLFPGEVFEMAEPVMGGEDMSFFLNEVPGTYFFLSTCDPEKHKYYHHNSKFDIDDGLIWKGTALFTAMAFKWLSENK